MFAALLDTCVLYPGLLRDFFLSLAAEGSYRPLWSSMILDELRTCEVEKYEQRGMAPLQAQWTADHLVETLREVFSDAEVHGWEQFESTFTLPDPDDRHVVAAALVGRADAIVTYNVTDFPVSQLPSTVELLSPPEFALNSVTLDPFKARRAIDGMVSRSGTGGRPRRSYTGICDSLASLFQMGATADYLRSLVDPGETESGE
jgi:predicted nucleic acid-binding protein